MPAEHGCDKGPVLDILKDGQEAIFGELKGIREILTDVAVQQNEIKHIKARQEAQTAETAAQTAAINALALRVTAMEQTHQQASQSLWPKLRDSVLIAAATAAVLFILGLFAFIAYDNIANYRDFQRGEKTEQHNKEES